MAEKNLQGIVDALMAGETYIHTGWGQKTAIGLRAMLDGYADEKFGIGGNDRIRPLVRAVVGRVADNVGCLPQQAMRDVMAEFRHYCDELGVDFDTLVLHAKEIYHEEKAESAD